MARNIVPRTDKGADLGTPAKKWNTVYADSVVANNVQGENLKAVEQSAGDEITLRSLIASAGSDPMSIVIYDDIPITDDLIIPENIELKFRKGGKLSVDATKTVTINGSISAGIYQIFGGDGNIGGSPKIDTIYPEHFGAKGDGVTNDQWVFSKLETFFNNAGGGKLSLVNGKTYIYGEQEFSGVADGYAYRPIGLMRLENIPYFELDGNGAALKLANGIKVGSFDPVSGEPVDSPTTNSNYRAMAPELVLNNVDNCIIRNLEINGNNENVELGGTWAGGYNTGAGNCLHISGKTKCLIENAYLHHAACDGLYIKSAISDRADDAHANIIVKNLRSEFNARQGMSYTGGQGGVFENCDFSYTGKGGFVTAPGAGVDIEATNSEIYQLDFINCRFIANAGVAVGSVNLPHDQVSFRGCFFWGTNYYTIWNTNPTWSFTECLVYGSSPYMSGNWNRCEFRNDITHPVYGSFNDYTGLIHGTNATFNDCKFIAAKKCVAYIQSSSVKFNNCEFIIKNDGSRTDGERVGMFYHAILKNCKFTTDLEVAPSVPFYIDVYHFNMTDSKNVVSFSESLIWRYKGDVPGVLTGDFPTPSFSSTNPSDAGDRDVITKAQAIYNCRYVPYPRIRDVDNNTYLYRKVGKTATLLSGTTSIAVDLSLDIIDDVDINKVSITPSSDLGTASYFYVTKSGAKEITIHVNSDPGKNVSFIVNYDAGKHQTIVG